jgi:hypothetical protein
MLLTLVAFLPLLAQDSPNGVGLNPTADEVVAEMLRHDAERRSALDGYTGARRYVLDNPKHHKHAEMVVSVTGRKDGSKQLEVVSFAGWGGARKFVFSRLLDAETEASRPGSADQARISPDNYSFRMLGREQVNGRPAYVLAVTPKTQSKLLIRGTIWVDAEDWAIVRVQGEPARSPSFWIRSVRIAHAYEKHGMFWLPASNTSVSDARIFGSTELRVDYFDYVVNRSPDAVRNTVQARLP